MMMMGWWEGRKRAGLTDCVPLEVNNRMRVKVSDWPSQCVNDSSLIRSFRRCVMSRSLKSPGGELGHWCNKEACLTGRKRRRTLVIPKQGNLQEIERTKSCVVQNEKNSSKLKVCQKSRRGEKLQADVDIYQPTLDSNMREHESTRGEINESSTWRRKSGSETLQTWTWRNTWQTFWPVNETWEDFTGKTGIAISCRTESGRNRLREGPILTGTPDWLTGWLVNNQAALHQRHWPIEGETMSQKWSDQVIHRIFSFIWTLQSV